MCALMCVVFVVCVVVYIIMYVCTFVHVWVCYNVLPVVFPSGNSSVVSCCFISYHRRESACLIL